MSEEATALLREIRDQQRLQLERQQEALRLQREHIDLYLGQLGRVERINDRAEAIQGRAARAVKFILWVAIPLVLVLFVLMFRPYLRGWLS